MIKLIDSHCHLDCIDLAVEHQASMSALLDEAKAAQVTHLLCVCIDLEKLPQIETISEQYPHVFHSVGVHPNEVTSNEPNAEQLCQLSSHKKCIAIGETGLDYFRSEGDLSWQRERFKQHIIAAKQVNKPLIIHTRDAYADTIKLMKEEGAEQASGVMHCFAEDWNAAKQALDLGFYISLSGIVTFKNAHAVHDVARNTPLDRLLIETDSPYLAPTPFRGKQNRPAWVKYVAEHIATLRNESIETIGEKTSENFFNLFSSAS